MSDICFVFEAGTPPPAYQPHDDNANMNNQNRNNHPRPHHQPMDTMPTPSHGNRVAGKQNWIIKNLFEITLDVCHTRYMLYTVFLE